MTRHCDVLTLQDCQLSRGDYPAEEGWWKVEMTEC